MNKLKLSVGILLVGCVAFATNFAACGSKSSGTGTGGAGGSSAGGSGGTTGAAGADPLATNPDGTCVAGAFKRNGVCACQSDTPKVCAAMCTDATTDVANCGTCGKACNATATCNAGTCGADVTNLVPAITGCMSLNLAVAGTTIYFTDTGHGTVNSVATTGGAVTKLVMGEVSPGMILTAGTNLFWISIKSVTTTTADGGAMVMTTTASIRKASTAGAGAADLVTETNIHGGINGMALNAAGDTLYYSADTNVKSIAVSGTATMGTIVAEEQLGGVPTGIGIEGTTLAYVTEINGDVDVVTIGATTAANATSMCPANTACCGFHDPADPAMENLLNTSCTRVARSQGAPFFGAMIVKGGNLYWSNDGSITTNSAAQVTTASAHGFNTDNMQVATTGGASVTAMAGDATNIYFAQDGLIQKTPYTVMSTAVNVARAQMAPSSIALDTTKVYWSTGDCAINSIPK